MLPLSRAREARYEQEVRSMTELVATLTRTSGRAAA
jgi:hypothetical protein